jgi:hypothetical protein
MENLLFGHAHVIYEDVINNQQMINYIYIENYANRHGIICVMTNLFLNIIVLSSVSFYFEVTGSIEQIFYIHEYDTYKKKFIVILKAIVTFVLYYYVQSMFMWSTWTNKIENQTLTFEST